MYSSNRFQAALDESAQRLETNRNLQQNKMNSLLRAYNGAQSTAAVINAMNSATAAIGNLQTLETLNTAQQTTLGSSPVLFTPSSSSDETIASPACKPSSPK